MVVDVQKTWHISSMFALVRSLANKIKTKYSIFQVLEGLVRCMDKHCAKVKLQYAIGFMYYFGL